MYVEVLWSKPVYLSSSRRAISVPVYITDALPQSIIHAAWLWYLISLVHLLESVAYATAFHSVCTSFLWPQVAIPLSYTEDSISFPWGAVEWPSGKCSLWAVLWQME